MDNKVFIAMKDISKCFGEVVANKDINFEVNSGEIHALLGENGAGKSTLMNMLSGIYKPDSGSIFMDNKEVMFNSPQDSIKAEIGMIHQHFKLIERLTAIENILGGQPGSIFINKKRLTKKVKDFSKKYGLEINLNKKVYDMSVGEKQTIEIIKVLYRGAKLLILDEPTAVLTPQETKKLFQILKNMKKEGCAIIIITHKLNEVMEISDRVTVLRKGSTIQTLITKDTSQKQLTELMVGKPVELKINRLETQNKRKIMQITDLNVINSEGMKVLDNISFSLNTQEILGVAGIANSGQKELCEAIVGLQSVTSGSVLYNGEELIGKTPLEIIYKGISMSFVPEDRLGMGLVASMDIVDNMILKDYRLQKSLLLDRKQATKKANEIVERLDISTPNVYTPVKNLSGGNIQKVLLGRELDSNPHVLITAYPVRGLDVGATFAIYDLLNEQKQKGVAILYVGEDIDALLSFCDRIMVLSDGKITGIVEAGTVNKEIIGFMMSGKTYNEAKEAANG